MLTVLAVLLPLLLALLAAPAVVVVGALRAASAAPVGVTFAALAALSTLWGWLGGGGVVDLAWAPAWELRFALSLDGLAALYALLATGIGFAVLVYSWRYLPLHLEHEGRPGSDAVRFYFFVLLFMGAMVGLAMAQDLILLFVFWDLTAVASYYLIGYDGHKEESRASALMALLVTGITAMLLLIGALFLYAAYGTFSIPELAELVEPGPLLTGCGLLIAVAGLAKSAQVPLHFWLPRAMAAPTPVSAYLHSAAMVAAGVLLIGRVYPLLQKSEFLLGVATLLDRGAPATKDSAGASQEAADVATWAVARLLYLPTLIVAAAILIKGYAETGDGFSAGVIAALGIVLRHLALGRGKAGVLPSPGSTIAVAFAGLLVALGVAAASLFLGNAVLTHYPPPGSEPVYLGTLELITAVLFDAGIFLLVFGFAVGVVSIFARTIAREEEYAGPRGGEER